MLRGENERKAVTRMSRFVRGVLLPGSSAPLLTVREAMFSIWGGLGLLLTILFLMAVLVLPMSAEQPVTLRLVASALVAIGCALAVSMMAAGVRNRIVQVVDEFMEVKEEMERAQARPANRIPVDDVEDIGEDGLQ